MPDPMDCVRAQIDPMIGVNARVNLEPLYPSPSTPFSERHLPANPTFQHEIAPMIHMRQYRCSAYGCPGHQFSFQSCS